MDGDELRPSFEVEVVLDGDDWPPTATEAAETALAAALEQMRADGTIRAFELRRG